MKANPSLWGFLEKVRRLSNGFCYLWNRWALSHTIGHPPIFIVGCGHSGTSLLLAILGVHPKIHAVSHESGVALGENERFFKKSLDQFDRRAIAAGKCRWVEKTPRHIFHIAKILRWRPGAKIILIIRDGRDVAWSIKQRTGNLEEGITRWCRDNQAGKAHWGNQDVYVLKYEDLITDFEATLKGVLSFLGEEYYGEMKNYDQTPKKWYSRKIEKPQSPFGSNHEQYRNWQINQPLFDGRAQWKRMTDEELVLIHNIAGPMLAEFGYATSLAIPSPSACHSDFRGLHRG